MKLRVLTFNMHKGYSPLGRDYSLTKIQTALRSLDLDLVFLQEVSGKPKATAATKQIEIEPQFEYLADTLWPHHAYGKNAVYRDGHHGNAILSRYPIEATHNLDLSTNKLERRGLLHAQIHIPSSVHPLHCFSVHLNIFARSRMKQLKALTEYLNQTLNPNDAFILAGDFNDWTQRLSHELVKGVQAIEMFSSCNGQHAKTFPSHMPILKLDRVYGRHVASLSASVLTGPSWRSLSDHLPILVELEIPEV